MQDTRTAGYIKPRIREFTSFQEAEENFSKYGNLFPYLNEGSDPVKDKKFFKRAFIVADPGYGKTRLLKEIETEVRDQKKIAIFVDLKKFADSKYPSLEEYLRNFFPELKKLDLKSINPTDAIFCFDALDEIRDGKFSVTVDELKRFITSYPSLSVLISSRIYFFKNHLFEINDPTFNYWLIYSFDHDQIKQYLSSQGVTPDSIDSILTLLRNRDRDLIISVPRYLKLLPEYLKKHKISELNELNRTELFEYFIFNKLDIEEGRSQTKAKEIVKRVLEMLALTMEIYQTNVLSKEEFTTFLDEVSSGLSQFWHAVPIKVFYENSLLKETNETIEFENTEFQEYLAAKHISRLNKPLQIAFDLVIDKEVEEIKPTWFSTLGFLSEIDQNFLKPLLDFGERNNHKLVIDERYFPLLTRFNVDQLTSEKKAEIFEFVFSYYQRVLHWIDWSIGKNLSFYYVDSLHDSIKAYAELPNNVFQNEDHRCVQLANVSQIIGYLIRHKKLTDEQLLYWKNKLLTFANETEGVGVLQRHAMFALAAFKDPNLIPQLTNPWKHRESLVRREFIEFCIETDPNNTSAIDCFISAIITKEHEGYQGIEKITESNSLLYLLKAFLKTEDLLESFIDRDEGIYTTKSTKLLANIHAAWNEELEKFAKYVVLKALKNRDTWHRAGDSKLILGLIKQLQTHNADYIYVLAEEVKNSETLLKHNYSVRKLFANLITVNSIERLHQELSQNENTKWFLLSVLRVVKYSKRDDAETVYEAGRKYFNEQYTEFDNESDTDSQDEIRAKSIYEDFKLKLQPEEGKYMIEVFDFFNDHYKEISSKITPEDKTRLIELLTGSIFSKFDPGEHGVRDSNNHQTHTMHSWISVFGDSIQTAHLLGLNISEYRSRIINYIPFTFDQKKMEAIFALVEDITSDETDQLIRRFQDRSDDTWRYHPSAFMQTVQKYKLQNALPILKKFVDESELSIYERIESMKVINGLIKDKEYIREILGKYINADDNRLAEEANNILISEYQDQSAIELRIEELKSRAFKFVRQEGVHSSGDQELELDLKKFAGPLFSISDKVYETHFLSLLEKSFNLIAQDKDYFSYASYLWDLVFKYFENRKKEGNYTPLKTLENFLAGFQGKEGVNWCMAKLKELKKVYLEYVGKPPSYSSCIQLYNHLKNSSYIKINDHSDLFQEVIAVIEDEIAKFLEGEGKECIKQGEVKIQKQLITQIENAFLRRNFRPSDIKQDFLVWRETQDISDNRCDFVITYGFLGPILIELKLTSNSDLVIAVPALKTKKSFKNLQQYIASFRPKYSIFLVLENKNRSARETKWIKHLANIKLAYEDISSVKVIGLPIPLDIFKAKAPPENLRKGIYGI